MDVRKTAEIPTKIPDGQGGAREPTKKEKRMLKNLDPLLYAKAKYVGMMVRKLLEVIFKRRSIEDRDHYSAKNLMTVGKLLGHQFHSALRKLEMEITNGAKNAFRNGNTFNVKSAIKPSIITNSLQVAITNNNWSTGGATSKGIAQLFEQLNHAAGSANIRKLNIPMAEGGSVIAPRDLHGSQNPVICPAETPEGKKCLVGETLISTPRGLIPIRDLKDGDEVLTIDPVSYEISTTLIHHCFSKRAPIVRIETVLADYSLVGTEDHPVLTLSNNDEPEWILLGQLSPGDHIFAVIGERTFPIEVSHIERHLWLEEVYDFTTTSENHTFIANGLVTHNCGLVKNLALVCHITVGADPVPIREIVQHLIYQIEPRAVDVFPASLNWCVVYVNGTPIGQVEDPENIRRQIIKLRRKSCISSETSVALFRTAETIVPELHISTEAGRFSRPCFVVEDGELLYNRSTAAMDGLVPGEMSWTELLSTGTIEILDKSEEESAILALYPSDLKKLDPEKRKRITHCEFHPSLMYGVGGSLVPFPDHNQSPRNCYQCIWKEELVLVSLDATKPKWKKIKNLAVGDEVVTFDPQTLALSITRVVFHITNPTDKKILRVSTKSGRTIVVTEDHKIMTKEGWKMAKELVVGATKVAVQETYAWTPMGKERWYGIMYEKVYHVESMPNLEISDITTESDNHSFIAGDGFCVHNSAMGKQAIGVPVTNYNQFMATGAFHVLGYLQRPLAMTRAAKYTHYADLPSGQMVSVAVMPCPDGEEDSIVFNQASLDNGYMTSYKHIVYYAECDDNERFGIPTEELCGDKLKTGKFGKSRIPMERPRGIIDPYKPEKRMSKEGYIKKGCTLVNGDIVIGKLGLKTGSDGASKYTDCSVLYDQPLPAVVHAIQIGATAEGYAFIRVMVVQKRIPTIADKFSFRSGQKGVMGATRSREDMPFDSNGKSPDMIINALAFPSRMTIALLIEILSGKDVCRGSPLRKFSISGERLSDTELSSEFTGTLDQEFTDAPSRAFTDMFCGTDYGNAIVDATPFRKFDLEVLRKEAGKYGFDLNGDEIMYDGVTGKRLKSMIFTGVAFHQRLKHMVIDKVHSRARGPRTTLTRQPVEGKSAGGGLRIGVMEQNVLSAIGAAYMVKDRLMEQSDEFKLDVCDVCGLAAHVEKEGLVKECRVCNCNQISRVRLPFGSKLISQELAGMNIATRILPTSY